jgi:hypothetical protein
MWWRKKKQPEFWDRADVAAEIVSWDERMDAYIALMTEDPEEYLSWEWDRAYRKEVKQRVRRRW